MSNFASQPDLWPWPALCAAVGAPVEAGPTVRRVVADSRLVESGDLFVALAGNPGERFQPSQRSDNDGHDYIAQAHQRGAVGALVSETSAQALADIPQLRVGNTYDGLWDLGRAARMRLSGQVLALTGSSGKTTAKNFIAHALSGYASPGSFNNHIGVPLALANAQRQAAHSIFELGTNHPGEIQPLAQMVQPDFALLLNVHSAHIENYVDHQALMMEKMSIFNSLSNKSNSIHEDKLGLDFGYRFGLSANAEAQILEIKNDLLRIRLFGQDMDAHIPGGGAHRATTLAATILTTHLLGGDVQHACELPDSLVPQGRGNAQWVAGQLVVDDSYNANPDSMAAALEAMLQCHVAGDLVAVVGEMLELGNESAEAHQGLRPVLQQFDRVYCVGPALQDLAQQEGFHWVERVTDDLTQLIARQTQPNSGIIVKGSNRVFWQNAFVDALVARLGA